MTAYDHLFKKAVDSIAVTFHKRAASGLQSGRRFILRGAEQQIQKESNLELITWIVIKTL